MKTSALALLLVTVPAFAQTPARPVEMFRCTASKPVDRQRAKTPERIAFGIANFGTPKKAELVSMDPANDMPIRVLPKNSAVNELNDNWGFQVSPQGIRLSGDADGFFLIEMVVYANSNFTKGYIRIRDISNEGIGNQYVPVSCEHRMALSRAP
jgi:hypothetical protein